MENHYKVIDVNKRNRKTQFLYFNKFSNSTYSFNVRLDVTNIVKYSKETKTSFFINFLYVLTLSLNEVEEFRLRYVDDEVRLYDWIRATYTVRSDDGTFNNARNEGFDPIYKNFYKETHEEVEKAKANLAHSDIFNDSGLYDDFYFTCLPTLDLVAMTHPINDFEKPSQYVPRALWSKFVLEGDRYKMMLNLTVSHALVDGFPLANGFLKIQENIDNFLKIIAKV